jgi:hypothetical protein
MATESLTHWLPAFETLLFEDIPFESKTDWDFFASQVMESLAADVEQGLDQTTTRPSMRLVLFSDLPQDIKKQLDALGASSPQNSDKLYEIAEVITEWLRENPIDYQTTLAAYLPKLSTSGIRVLLSAFSDSEIDLESVTLLHAVAAFMLAEDKRLAQVAATCLLVCGGEMGKKLVDEKLQVPQTMPHAPLVQGIVNLFSSQ